MFYVRNQTFNRRVYTSENNFKYVTCCFSFWLADWHPVKVCFSSLSVNLITLSSATQSYTAAVCSVFWPHKGMIVFILFPFSESQFEFSVANYPLACYLLSVLLYSRICGVWCSYYAWMLLHFHFKHIWFLRHVGLILQAPSSFPPVSHQRLFIRLHVCLCEVFNSPFVKLFPKLHLFCQITTLTGPEDKVLGLY